MLFAMANKKSGKKVLNYINARNNRIHDHYGIAQPTQ